MMKIVLMCLLYVGLSVISLFEAEGADEVQLLWTDENRGSRTTEIELPLNQFRSKFNLEEEAELPAAEFVVPPMVKLQVFGMLSGDTLVVFPRYAVIEQESSQD